VIVLLVGDGRDGVAGCPAVAAVFVAVTTEDGVEVAVKISGCTVVGVALLSQATSPGARNSNSKGVAIFMVSVLFLSRHFGLWRSSGCGASSAAQLHYA
jgi:hypothetical protein